MSKYEPLRRHLLASSELMLELRFTDIEEILGFPLPASARRHAAWWSNSDGSHVQAQAWLGANFETTDVDIPGERLRFLSATQSKGFGEMQQATVATKPSAQTRAPKRHPLFGVMKGSTIIMPGVDLTAPADPDWGNIYDEDYDHGVITNPQDTKSK